jgi:predicted outer membrane repeat protein
MTEIAPPIHRDAPRRFRRLVLLVVAAVALVLAAVAVPQAAQAAVINVADETELQNAANAAVAGDTINITAPIALLGPVTFPTGVTVQGSVPGIVISRANNAAYHLFLFAPTAISQAYTVQNLTFDGTVGNGSAVVLVDGAIDVADATFTNVVVHDFTAGALSAIYVERITSEFTVDGGSDFSDNESVTGSGGAIGGTFFNSIIQIQDSTFSDNRAADSGGAVYLDGDNAFTVDVDNTTFTDNIAVGAVGGGGALMVTGLFTVVELTGNLFQENTALGNGGGASIGPVLFDITVSGTTFRSNNSVIGIGGGLWASAGQDALIEDSAFDLNSAPNGGGGARVDGTQSFDVRRSTFTGNSTLVTGGGLLIGPSGPMNFDDLTVTGNTAQFGGGIGSVANMARISTSRFAGNTAVWGGALYAGSQTGDFAIGQSTFDGNTASSVAPVEAFGAAIAVEEALAGSAVRFYNSTFSNNVLDSGVGGDGVSLAILSVEDDAFLDYSEDTFDEPFGGGHVIYVNGVPAAAEFSLDRDTIVAQGGVYLGNVVGPAQIYNTILDGDSADTGLSSLETSAGTVATSWSIIDEPVTAAYNDLGGNQFGLTDAQLGPLQDNGGVTFTRLPLAGSAALDLGDPAPGFAPSYDQRLTPFTRIVNGRIDIGSVEVQAAQLALSGSEFSWPTLYLGLFGVFAGMALVGADRRRAVR